MERWLDGVFKYGVLMFWINFGKIILLKLVKERSRDGGVEDEEEEGWV